MNMTSSKMHTGVSIPGCRPPIMQSARQRSQPHGETARKRFLLHTGVIIAVCAGALLLFATVNIGVGECIDDPCKFPSLGYLFEPSLSFQDHRHDDASGTFCAPCYGYRPTCWRGWPDCCVPCPPPANYVVPGSTGSPMIKPPVQAPDRATNPEPIPLPTCRDDHTSVPPAAPVESPPAAPVESPPAAPVELPPAAPSAVLPVAPQTLPQATPSAIPPTGPAAVPPTMPVESPVAPSPAASLPPPAALPPATSATLPSSAVPAEPPESPPRDVAPLPPATLTPAPPPVPQPTIPAPNRRPRYAHRRPAQPPIVYRPTPRPVSAVQLPLAPMPPEISLSKPIPRVLPENLIAPRSAARSRNVVLMSATLPSRPAIVEDLGVAPMPPALSRGTPIRLSASAQRALFGSAELDLAPMPPELPHLAEYFAEPVTRR